MTIATLGLALFAGMLSALSPCVLPLLPIVLGPAASAHRLGPVALAAGLCASFVTIGLFVATIGFAIGLDGGVFRFVAAATMIAIGTLLLVPRGRTGGELVFRISRYDRQGGPRRPGPGWRAAGCRVEPVPRSDAQRCLGARSTRNGPRTGC